MSNETVNRWPLSWPTGWPRTPAADRGRPTFGERKSVTEPRWSNEHKMTVNVTSLKEVAVTMPTARDRVFNQLERLGAKNVLLSTNLELTSYGLPRADRGHPQDPGVAVYFELNGKDRVLACDRWKTVAGNLAALAAHIDAIRRVERYGVGTIDQAFTGYDALPAPDASNRPPWRSMLGFKPDTTVTPDDVKVNYRALAKQAATDENRLLVLNLARDAALMELGQ